LAIRLLLPDYGLPFITFYPAVAIVTLLCGIAPGLVMVALGVVAGYFFLAADVFSAASLSREAPVLAVFVIAASIVCLITDQLARYLRRMLDANARLQHDIRQHRHAESAIRESEQHFRSLFELFGIGVCLCDATTGQYLRVNRKF